MTQFRSKGKGKDRKSYPINKKKPYGISREVAYEDVQALRNKGQKARLIETNRKKKLYAPYEGMLPVDKGEDEQKPEPQGTQKIEPISIHIQYEMMSYADQLSDKKYGKPLVEKYDFGPVAFKADYATIGNADTPEKKEAAQKIIDEVSKKYGINFSLKNISQYNRMDYTILSPGEKVVRYEAKKTGNASQTAKTDDNVKVKFDMDGNTRRGGVYAAVITGTDPKYGLKREWLNGDTTKLNNHNVSKHFNTELPKGTIVELGSDGSGEFYIVDPKAPDGDGLRSLNLSNKGQDLLKMKQHFRKKEEQ